MLLLLLLLGTAEWDVVLLLLLLIVSSSAASFPRGEGCVVLSAWVYLWGLVVLGRSSGVDGSLVGPGWRPSRLVSRPVACLAVSSPRAVLVPRWWPPLTIV